MFGFKSVPAQKMRRVEQASCQLGRGRQAGCLPHFQAGREACAVLPEIPNEMPQGPHGARHATSQKESEFLCGGRPPRNETWRWVPPLILGGFIFRPNGMTGTMPFYRRKKVIQNESVWTGFWGLHPWPLSSRMPLGFTIWAGMRGNGTWTGLIPRIQRRPVCCAVATGRSARTKRGAQLEGPVVRARRLRLPPGPGASPVGRDKKPLTAESANGKTILPCTPLRGSREVRVAGCTRQIGAVPVQHRVAL
jgi:hypothetical protein